MEAVVHLIAWFLLFPLRSAPDTAVKPQLTYWTDLREGFTYLTRDTRLIRILVFGILANWMITPVNALLAPFAKDVIRGGANTFSLLELALVIGGIGMSLLYARLADRLDLMQMFYLSMVLQGGFTLLIGLTTTLPFAFSGMLLLGMALSLFGIPFSTLLQQTTPDALLGRIRSAMVAASTFSSALFFGLSAYLTTVFAIDTVFLFFSGSGLLVLLLLRLQRKITGGGSATGRGRMTNRPSGGGQEKREALYLKKRLQRRMCKMDGMAMLALMFLIPIGGMTVMLNVLWRRITPELEK